MKKIKCKKFGWNIVVFIFVLFGTLHILGIPFGTRFGWETPNLADGLLNLGIALVIYKLVNYYYEEAGVVKCTSCGEVFSESDVQNGDCPKCQGKLIDVEKYYDKSNKSEELIKNPQADS